MADTRASIPASLQVYRYTAEGGVRAVIGELEPSLPQDELATHAAEALAHDAFMCFAVCQANDFVGDEICFIPQGERCEILSIRTNGWQRHHGDHRRSLVEILNNLAAAVACGKLRVLDDAELAAERDAGEPLLEFAIDDSASLAAARDAVADVLCGARLADDVRRRTVLCVSEAVDQHAAARRRQRAPEGAAPAGRAALRGGRPRARPELPQLDRAAVQGRPGLHGLRLQDHRGQP